MVRPQENDDKYLSIASAGTDGLPEKTDGGPAVSAEYLVHATQKKITEGVDALGEAQSVVSQLNEMVIKEKKAAVEAAVMVGLKIDTELIDAWAVRLIESLERKRKIVGDAAISSMYNECRNSTREDPNESRTVSDPEGEVAQTSQQLWERVDDFRKTVRALIKKLKNALENNSIGMSANSQIVDLLSDSLNRFPESGPIDQDL